MIFDAHGDILTDMYEQSLKGNKNSFKKRHLNYYKEGNITHSIFVNWTDPKEKNPDAFNNIFENAFKEISINSDIFHVCKNTSDMQESLKLNKIGVILGIEGIKNLQGVKHLEELYQKGVRHASLTWNEKNSYASGLDDDKYGLTEEGRKIITRMEDLGMIIDLAHTNKHTFNDIINMTSSPVIISHGNAKALCSHRRNYTDEQLHMIKEKNGVIGVCAIMPFVGDDIENQTVSYMAKHIRYIADLIGVEHVGLGFDVCYYLYDNVEDNKMPGFKNLNDTGNLIQELKSLGFTEKELELIKYKNFERVIKEILG